MTIAEIRETDKMIDMIAEAYITVYGFEKWNSLTDTEKHDVVMILVKDLHKTLDRMQVA